MYNELMKLPGDVNTVELDELNRACQRRASGTALERTYIGTPYSFVPLHLGDAYMPTANILAAGSPKVWIFLPKKSLDLVLKIVSG
jgi:hypothetical protein